jgi:hypothetical protein
LTSAMMQQGQTIALTRRGPGGELLWAYRYRIPSEASSAPSGSRGGWGPWPLTGSQNRLFTPNSGSVPTPAEGNGRHCGRPASPRLVQTRGRRMSDRDPQLDQVVSWGVSPWRTVDTCVMTPATKTSRFSMSALRLGR